MNTNFAVGGERPTGEAENPLTCRHDPPTASRQSRVINRAYVKTWALDYAHTRRSHPFNRVSAEFLNAVEAATKSFIRHRIDTAPSRGKTLR